MTRSKLHWGSINRPRGSSQTASCCLLLVVAVVVLVVAAAFDDYDDDDDCGDDDNEIRPFESGANKFYSAGRVHCPAAALA